MKIHWNWRRKTNVLKERYAWNHSHGLSSDRKQPVGTNMIFSCCRCLPLILQFIRNVLNYWDCILVLHMQLSFWLRVQQIFCLLLPRIWNRFVIHGISTYLWFEKGFELRQYLPRYRLFWTFSRNFLGTRFFPQPYLFILNHHWVLFSFHNIVIYKVNHVWSTWTLKRNCNWLLYVCMKLFMCRLCSESRLHFRFFLTLSV